VLDRRKKSEKLLEQTKQAGDVPESVGGRLRADLRPRSPLAGW
jgi:hypothetical protein